MYYFIVNPGSKTGKAGKTWKILEDRLKGSKAEYRVFFTSARNNAEKIAERICSAHPEMKRIVIAGGDGTVNEALNGLSDHENIILSYIPMGSSNDFARGLGMSQSPVTAMNSTIQPRNIVRVDYGTVTSEDGNIKRKFAVSSGIGYDADICDKAANSWLKKVLNRFGLGKLIYYLIGFVLVFTNKQCEAVITIDGKRTIKCKSLLFAACMNTRYEGGGMPMAPAANPFDGKITACIAHDIPRLKHLYLMSKIIKGRHIEYSGVDQISAKTIDIKTGKPMTIHTDGEIVGKNTNVRFSCSDDKIRMIV